MTRPDPRRLRVLLVEDDDADVTLLLEAMADVAAPFDISAVVDGEEALRFLRQEGEHTEAPDIDLVLLDLNLPLLGGRDVLAAMKADTALELLPVIVMSTSDSQDDIAASYREGATAYVTKPVEYDDFLAVVRQIVDFFTHVHLPGRTS